MAFYGERIRYGYCFGFKICRNKYLEKDCEGYYYMDIKSVRQGGELTFLHTLKNNKLNVAEADLIEAKNKVVELIADFLSEYSRICSGAVVCRVPRSKTYFNESQLYFQQAIREAIASYFDCSKGFTSSRFIDGIDYIQRIKDVATTHLAKSQLAQATLRELCSGDKPYPGITKDSCFISDKVQDKTILLIDDIYTLGVNVVEDCIQALYDKGAGKVEFYAVGRTEKWGNTPQEEILLGCPF